jgi:hypothetical protein
MALAMKWLLHPSLLAFSSVALALVATVLVLWKRTPEIRTEPLPVKDGEREIVWLDAATSASTWERFVGAVHVAGTRLEREHAGLTVDTSNAFPRQTTAVPEIAIALPNRSTRLVFRWYKLTSNQKSHDWIKALTERKPPPLAIIGGSTSDVAIELARQLRDFAKSDEEAPLLFLTTATADNVLPTDKPVQADEVNPVSLNRIYDGRTFRFCFTNQQMADAITDFVWSQNELRPDSDPVYMVSWEDDPYSRDLTSGFYRALRRPAVEAVARDVASVVPGGFPTTPGNWAYSQFRYAMQSPPQQIDSSVGGFNRPNRFEAVVAEYLMDELENLRNHGPQRQPLLVLSGQTQPSRRFLQALVRISPLKARRFVVVSGDAIAFNTIYRDRRVAWPIQDLPFSLVVFAHRNPMDAEAGFTQTAMPQLAAAASSTTGTEDLLLFVDMVEALCGSMYQGNQPPANARQLGERLRLARQVRLRGNAVEWGDQGTPMFDELGNRYSGMGEHVVWLKPTVNDERVKPEATITVWAEKPTRKEGSHWRKVGEILGVSYDPAAGGGVHGGN